MSIFLKGKSDFESLSLSDISDVDPEEIEKIIKSASEIDEKFIGSEKKKTPNKEEIQPSKHGRISGTTDLFPVTRDPLSGAETSLLRKEELPNFTSTLDFPFGEKTNVEKKARGSGDWLGLKDSPEKGRKTDVGGRDFPGSGLVPGARGSSANKDRLLDELFGKSNPPSEANFKPKTETEKDVTYEPSAVGSYLPSGVKSTGFEPSATDGFPPSGGRGIGYEPSATDSYMSSGARSGPRRPPSGRMPEWKTKDVEDKVAEDILASSEPRTKRTAGNSGAGGLPDWLRGVVEEKEEVRTTEKKEDVSRVEKKIDIPTPSPQAGGRNLLGLLTTIQKELDSAIAKRNETVQHYMKALIIEAEKMGNITDIVEDLTHQKRDLEETDCKVKQMEEKDDLHTETINQQEEQIQQVQISLKEMDLQNKRLQLEIENLETIHKMEVETLQKNHKYEISALESRIERMKISFDEIEAEYKEKLVKLKDNENSLVKEHEERLERAEKMRLAEMEKLHELHQAAIQQVAALTIPLQNSDKVVRIPLISSVRPKDESELTDRETTLLEKEKQVEVVRGLLQAEREELETARMAQEERERELRRTERESRRREEARQSEAAREKAHLTDLASHIKEMRDEAVREQGELAKEKLELAAERARLEALYSIHGRSDSSISPLDFIQARVEVEAALEAAKVAQEAAELERRKHAERRQTVDQISWEQKEADLRLENRERHLARMLENAEKIRNEGLAALDEAKNLQTEIERKKTEFQEQVKKVEAQEKILSKERLDIAKEKIELERKRSQLDVLLPDLMTSEDISMNVPRVFVDPKAVILRLKAEKEFESSTSLKIS